MDYTSNQSTLKKIISGGQTGVDRGTLDVALESGEIFDRYSVKELKGVGYKERTSKNVIDSDRTVMIYFDFLTGGTEDTVAFCIQEKKPYLLIDVHEVLSCRASERIIEFIGINHISILNVAGSRASQNAVAYEFANTTLRRCLN